MGSFKGSGVSSKIHRGSFKGAGKGSSKGIHEGSMIPSALGVPGVFQGFDRLLGGLKEGLRFRIST